jgi:hypothetical protein
MGREQDALRLADEAERQAQPDDLEPRSRQRWVRARVLARRGDFAGADELIREAITIVGPTDYVIQHIDLGFAHADVERLAGRPAGERAALERTRAISEQKGNLVAVEKAGVRLSELAT